MKTYHIIIACVMSVLTFIGCKKESSPIIAVDNGRWKVVEFSENGEDKKALFSGYSLEFKENYLAVASNGSKTVNGSWSAGEEAHQLKFIIRFQPDPLNKISKDWTVLDQCGNYKMVLRHNNGVGMDYLTLQKK